MRSHIAAIIYCCVVLFFGTNIRAEEKPTVRKNDNHPLTPSERNLIAQDLQTSLDAIGTDAKSMSAFSRRGDLLFFLGRYKQAVENYRAMVKLDPEVDASHWRLGIAYFFAEQPALAVAQFEKYHSYDNVDRENGIWRYLSHYKTRGSEGARKELLRYDKDDREPFPAVYKLFDDSLTPTEALAKITDDLSDTEKDKRLFYTELYIGMHYVVQKKPDDAIKFLKRSVSRRWPRQNGFGPDYMWHVARVQLDDLLKHSR